MKAMRKPLALVLTFAILLAFVPVAAPVAQAAFTPITGWDMMEKLGVGYNLGHLESWNYTDRNEDGTYKKMGLESEVSWGGERIEQWQLKSMVQKGFSSVRYIISWQPHLDDDYIIDKEWMDRIVEVVDMALEEGLYVIINTHHEHLFHDFLGDGNYEEAKRYLFTVWTQIAERFKNYSEKLIFEPMNEPWPRTNYGDPDADGGAGWQSEEWTAEKEIAEFAEKVNELNGDALNLIRKSGGYNDKRVVMLTITQAESKWLWRYKHPDDPYTMVGVFFYPSGKYEEIAFQQVEMALDKGIPVVIKETFPLNIDSSDQAMEWSKATYKRLADMGAVPMIFDLLGGGVDFWSPFPMTIFEKMTGEWYDAWLEIIFKAYGKTMGTDYPPPPPDLPYELKEPYTEKQFTFWTPPTRELAAAEKMVVEYEGRLNSGYAFVRFTSDWAQFNNGDKRITEEPGKLTFDIRGLEGNTVGFAAWGAGDAAKIKRIYLDTWEGSEVPNLATADSWAHDHIQQADAKGFLPATLQNNYKADITRGEFVTLAMSWLRYKTNMTNAELLAKHAKPENMDRTFTDTADADILAAARLDITAGTGGGQFGVNTNFNREQAAIMLMKICRIVGTFKEDTSDFGFTDIDAAQWLPDALNYVGHNGVMSGKLGGRFAPKDNFQRQESIIVFNKMG
ncbi:MAG: cellulase family glycosylhydrolase [Oscillospiraceae bacterium]|jgi:hypothetical protein|nr:cellulase family glycosylhydrolase [Oscillospiraceae bacterium]